MGYGNSVLNHPVPRELLSSIGDVTVSFALLENAVQALAGSLIYEHQRVGQIVTTELSFRNLRALTISLYLERHGNDADLGDLRSLMRDASRLEAERNRIVHSIWGAGDSADSIHRIKATAKEKAGLRFESKRYTAAELQQVADEIKLLAGHVQGYWLRLMQSGKAINNPTAKLW